MEDLLPSPQDGGTVFDGHSNFWPHPSSLEMGVGIAIMPGLFMPVVPARRDEFVQDFRHIAFQSGLKLNSSNRPCGPDIENMGCSNLDPGIPDNPSNPGSDVLHVPMARGGKLYLVLVSHREGGGLPVNAPVKR